jgi:hypothetical protein
MNKVLRSQDCARFFLTLQRYEFFLEVVSKLGFRARN